MPYIARAPYTEGQTPNIRWTDDTNYFLQSGEVRVEKEVYDAAWEDPYGAGVWDSLKQTLRRRTLPEKLTATKAAKGIEFFLNYIRDLKNLFSETANLPGIPPEAWIAQALTEIATNNNPPRRQAMAQLAAKYKRAQANIASTDNPNKQTAIDTVNALDWSVQ